jgi:ornithine cyclodeaminase/alanine dehydrogenase-like protein (mu-crystallin family)
VLSGTWKPPEQIGITLFESHGLALWDLAASSVVLAGARERRIGEEIQLF